MEGTACSTRAISKQRTHRVHKNKILDWGTFFTMEKDSFKMMDWGLLQQKQHQTKFQSVEVSKKRGVGTGYSGTYPLDRPSKSTIILTCETVPQQLKNSPNWSS